MDFISSISQWLNADKAGEGIKNPKKLRSSYVGGPLDRRPKSATRARILVSSKASSPSRKISMGNGID